MGHEFAMKKEEMPDDLWIFGYGSIVWKNDEIHHTEVESGWIRGYRRRFWQSSPDHRGTVDNPGLVTSIYSPHDLQAINALKKDSQQVGPDGDRWIVGGRAFRVTKEYRQQVSCGADDAADALSCQSRVVCLACVESCTFFFFSGVA